LLLGLSEFEIKLLIAICPLLGNDIGIYFYPKVVVLVVVLVVVVAGTVVVLVVVLVVVVGKG